MLQTQEADILALTQLTPMQHAVEDASQAEPGALFRRTWVRPLNLGVACRHAACDAGALAARVQAPQRALAYSTATAPRGRCPAIACTVFDNHSRAMLIWPPKRASCWRCWRARTERSARPAAT